MPKRKSKVQPDSYKDVFGALAHPARRRVLLTVYFHGGAMSAGEIASIFAHAWQTTTRHLQVLEAAGLLTHERRGRMRVYRLERARLALVSEWLEHFQRKTKYRVTGKQNGHDKKTKSSEGEAFKRRSA